MKDSGIFDERERIKEADKAVWVACDQAGGGLAKYNNCADNWPPTAPFGNVCRRERSKADFVAKAGISLEEADECLYWMEMLQEAGIFPADKLKDLMKEADELIAIFTASIKTARANLK